MEFDDSKYEKRLKELYPAVDVTVTPLPTKWSSRDKYQHLNVFQDGLRVLYNGQGKNHKDAGSVRANYPIPVACGLYYFEIKVITKGRDGYMGIGLSDQGTNLNRLPGWEKFTYGYHGDDGHKFFSTGNGLPYGPTFSTDDVIGCCLNLISNSCFYTKNGIHIGDAFHNLPQIPLYPTVGLQTPNEELIANFGQFEFVFDFADYSKEWRNATQSMIYKHILKDDKLHMSDALNQLVQSYLVHHGYVKTFEAFSTSIGDNQAQKESLESIKSRQHIKELVLNGQISDAIKYTNQLFPQLLSSNPNLFFILKVRQFIEMVNGTDSEIYSLCNNKNDEVKRSLNNPPHEVCFESPPPSEPMNIENNSKFEYNESLSDVEMETDSVIQDISNGVSNGKPCIVSNGVSDLEKENFIPKLCGGNPIAIKHMVEFGQTLLTFLKKNQTKTNYAKNKRILLDAYSLLAYTDPWNSPVGYQLNPNQRETVFASLNSAILKSQNLPTKPPIQTLIGQSQLCLKEMLANKIGTAAFVSLSEYLS